MKTPEKRHKSQIKRENLTEGETIEHKVSRIVENGEPIEDGATEIFTERGEGVLEAYDVRTDRWEIAAGAMDKVEQSKAAKAKPKPKTETKPEPKTPESGGAKQSEQ